MLFVTVADNRVGFGHLNRCLSIAAVSVKSGVEPRFAVFGDELAAKQVCSAGYPLSMLPMTDLQQDVDIGTADALVADVVYPAFFRDGNSPVDLFQKLRRVAHVVTAIDSLGDESLAERASDISTDYLLVPYALDETDRARLAKVRSAVLAGPEFAQLSLDYIGLPAHTARLEGDRVLITCGGSDPLAWTPVVLTALDDIAEDLDVRVIVGPLFSSALRADITKRVAASHHRVELIESPSSLIIHMQWCDVAIAASGLTKYELAAAGTPTILFSIDAFHHHNNRGFAALGIADDLGASPSRTAITAATRAMLKDGDRRESMSAAARRVVDGQGAQRLINTIMDKLSCSKKN